ncbi:hypothetical protein VTI28DRAFT_10048 [Corynascus sepedonium]
MGNLTWSISAPAEVPFKPFEQCAEATVSKFKELRRFLSYRPEFLKTAIATIAMAAAKRICNVTFHNPYFVY